MLARLGSVVLWASYVFAAFLLGLLVYAFSIGGARDVATWIITLAVCAAAIVIGHAIQYFLAGNQKGPPKSDDLYFGDFEHDGEDAVRKNLALKLYQPKKAALAEEWLARKEEARRSGATAEQLRFARSEKNATWVAAIMAIATVIVAIIAYLK